MLELKGYQKKALESLRLYLRACDELKNADMAFIQITKGIWGEALPYRRVAAPPELADIPYVCLRLPTGGGKTLLACHAVGEANREYLKRDNSFVLWLVPSNAIKDQTLKALRDSDHPYRQALEDGLGRVTVLDLAETLFLQQSVLLSSTVILVATLQAFRVEEKEGRKVYESAGALQHHFTDLPADIKGKLARHEDGTVPYSLENVLRIHRPLVIVDEAHNARTDLSFDTLARFLPSAIIEFSATPDKDKNPSNVLHSVSALELKAADMVKLPILLETRNDWKALLSDAVSRLDALDKLARIEKQKTGDYIRPIMLLQAQPDRQGQETISVEVLEKGLIEDHRIPADRIARATGEDRGLDGVDLFSEGCNIRFIITKQALREGWDCSFAYILYSVAEQRASGAVEQILGRVLRLPYAKPREAGDLGRAYAFVRSVDFAHAAKSLVDALVENGFNKQEAQDVVTAAPASQSSAPLVFGRTLPPRTIHLEEVPRPADIPVRLRDKVEVNIEEKTVTLKAPLDIGEAEELKEFFPKHTVAEKLLFEVEKYRADVAEAQKTPSEKGAIFKVPTLCLERDGELELFEEDHLLDVEWSLRDFEAKLSEAEYFRLASNEGTFGEIDVQSGTGQVGTRFIQDLGSQLALLTVAEGWTDTQLVGWLDRYLLHRDIAPDDKRVYVNALIGDVLKRPGMTVPVLVRKKFDLRKIVDQKIVECRKEVKRRTYQKLLFPETGSPKIVVTPDRCFSFEPEKYPCPDLCRSPFSRHFYPRVGKMDSGEELSCANFIDTWGEIDFWVRNLAREPELSFWLQTSTDKFYPDFVCKLKDGRILVVEHKSVKDFDESSDASEKRRLGELWAEKSGGRCLFVMTRGTDWERIRITVKGGVA